MKNINLKQIGIYTVLVIAVILFLQKCNNDRYQQMVGEYKVLKENYDKQKVLVDSISFSRQKLKDSLTSIIKERENKTTILQKENTSLKGKIAEIKNKPNKQPKDLQGLADYFNEQYQTKENVVVENKVGLGQDTAMDVSFDLGEGKKAIEIVPILEEVNKNQGQIIENQAKDKADLSTMLGSAEEEIKKREELQKLAEKNIENLNKQNKKLKTKNVLNKVLIGVGVIGGFLIGNSL